MNTLPNEIDISGGRIAPKLYRVQAYVPRARYVADDDAVQWVARMDESIKVRVQNNFGVVVHLIPAGHLIAGTSPEAEQLSMCREYTVVYRIRGSLGRHAVGEDTGDVSGR